MKECRQNMVKKIQLTLLILVKRMKKKMHQKLTKMTLVVLKDLKHLLVFHTSAPNLVNLSLLIDNLFPTLIIVPEVVPVYMILKISKATTSWIHQTITEINQN